MHAPSFEWTMAFREITVRGMGQAKNKKQRGCPAKGGIITPEDCGRGRNSTIACPVECPHNPFSPANFRDHYLPLEAKVIDHLSRKLAGEITPSQARELMDAADSGDDFLVHALHTRLLLAGGRLARWMADDFTRHWKNDEVAMLGYFRTLRPALIEFHEVTGEATGTAIDWLQPDMPSFTLIDAGIAAVAGRYEVMLGWLHDLPAGQRLSGGPILLPSVAGMDPGQIFSTLLNHLGAPEDDRESWLMEHMPLLADAFAEIDKATTIPGAAHDRDLVPPAFLLTPKVAELESLHPDFADVPQPALGGKSPREAANQPELRPQLVLFMKEQVRHGDRLRRTRGEDIDLNPLLQELGLGELVLAPPPVGFVDDQDILDDIPLDPPPPQELLDGSLLGDRLDAATDDETLWNRLEIRLADVLDAFNDLSDKLNPNELEALQSTALAALGALHPDQVTGYDPDTERMLARYESWITSGTEQESLGEYLDRIFAETRQPALCEAAADMLFAIEGKGAKKFRPKKLDAMLTALAAAIWEAAHWPPVLKS